MKKEIEITWDIMEVLKEATENNNTEMIKTWTCIVDNNFDGRMFLDDIKSLYLLIKKNKNVLVVEDEEQKVKYYKLFCELLAKVKKYIQAVENREIFACIYVNVADYTIFEIEKITDMLK